MMDIGEERECFLIVKFKSLNIRNAILSNEVMNNFGRFSEGLGFVG